MLCFLHQTVTIRAEGCAPIRWQRPVTVSRPESFSSAPTLVTDPAGNVHLFYTEYLEVNHQFQSLVPETDVIMYSRWDGNAWSPPMDVLPSPDGSSIIASTAVADHHGQIHFLWFTSYNVLYYSRVFSANAGSAKAWTSPMPLATGLPTHQIPAAIAVDSANTLHTLYTPGNPPYDVAYVRSKDSGNTWSPPISLYSDINIPNLLDLVASSVAFSIGDDDVLHAGWTLNNREGFGEYIIYTRSEDRGQSWAPPTIIATRGNEDYEADWLALKAQKDGQIVLVWAGRGYPPGRSYRVSHDNGHTWEPPIPFMPGLVGETENIRIVADTYGNAHLFTPARSSNAELAYGSGMRHLCWDGSVWTSPELLPGPPEKPVYYGGLATAATVRLGNEFFVAYHDQGKGSVEVFHGVAEIPSLPPKAIQKTTMVVRPTESTFSMLASEKETLKSAPQISSQVETLPLHPVDTMDRLHALISLGIGLVAALICCLLIFTRGHN